MKKRYLIFLLVAFLSISFVQALTASWSFDCDGCCVEDKSFTSSFTITNNEYSYAIFIDSVKYEKDGSKFAQWGTIDSSGYYIEPGSSKTVTVSGNWPSPSSGNTVDYIPCLYHSYKTLGITRYKWSCWAERSRSVTAKENYECYSNSQCADSEYCSENNCITECKPVVAQSDCGHIVNHEWVNYQCCADSDCSSSQQCSNNYCVDVPCECGYHDNHQCIKYDCCADNDCNYGEYCSNHQCIKHECVKNSDCDSTKICQNNKCSQITCASDEHIVDHQCVKYECMEDNTCAFDEYCSDHKCIKTVCGVGQKIENHQCVSSLGNFSQPLLIGGSLLVIGLLVFVVITQIKKIKHHVKHKKEKDNPKKKHKESKEEKKKGKCECGAKITKGEKFCHKCGRKV